MSGRTGGGGGGGGGGENKKCRYSLSRFIVVVFEEIMFENTKGVAKE